MVVPMKEFDVVGFGALNYDRLYIVREIPKGGDEIVIKSIREDPGGSAANTIVGLARLGLKTGFIGIVGFDTIGRLIIEAFEKENVDTRGISVTSGGRTGLVIGFVDRKGERALTVEPGINNDLKLTDINIGYAKRAKLMHLSSFVSSGQLKEQVFLVEESAKNNKDIKFSFSPGMIYVRKGIDKLLPILRHCNVTFLHEKEMKLLTGLEYKKGCDALIRKGVEIVVVTLGVKGCYITDGNKSEFIASQRPEVALNSSRKVGPKGHRPVRPKVVDTTGAGDAFAAGFLYGFLTKQSLQKCGALGNWMASECVTKYGARRGLIYSLNKFKELFLNKHKDSQMSLYKFASNS